MIQPLRQYHRYAFTVLAAVLPAIWVAGLAARRPIVIAEPGPCRIELATAGGNRLEVDARELWGSAVDAPDALIYWSEEAPAAEHLPVKARLLGSLQSARHGAIFIPSGEKGRGYLLLYSLAWQKLAGTTPVPKEAL